jgi:hypothetical protein
MTYIPSTGLADVLERAALGVWIEHLHDGRDALVCKVPETVSKAVYRGAACLFLPMIVPVADRDVLCLGLKVLDEPDHPLTAVATTTIESHVIALKNMLVSRSTTLHLLNELNHPVLSASCALDAAAAQLALDRLCAATPYVLRPPMEIPPVPQMLRIVNDALDRFQRHAYASMPVVRDADSGALTAIPLTVDIWPIIDLFEVTPTAEGGPFRIDDSDEGAKLERSLQVALDSIYPGSTFRSPSVRSGAGRRELTDLLAYDGESICLVEAKALSVLGPDLGRPSDRRAATVTKHVTKAMQQLHGALTNLRSTIDIIDASGKPIAIANRDASPAHAIVLLSEMYAFLDWRSIARELADASEDPRHRALFHVLDLTELSSIVRASQNAATFHRVLMQRWLHVKMKGTAYGRVATLGLGDDDVQSSSAGGST